MPNRNDDPQAAAVIDKYRRQYERDEAKAEALEDKMTKSLAAALRRDQQRLAKEFMYSKDVDPTGRRALDQQTDAQRDLMMRDDNWGDEVTGDEDIIQRLKRAGDIHEDEF